MKVLWTHNFPPDLSQSGVFMKNMYNSFQDDDLEIDTLYLGNLKSVIQIIRSIIIIYKTSKNMILFMLNLAQYVDLYQYSLKQRQ